MGKKSVERVLLAAEKRWTPQRDVVVVVVFFCGGGGVFAANTMEKKH